MIAKCGSVAGVLVTEPDGRTTAYEYDLAGNRLKETVTEGGIVTEIIYAYGSQNWLTGTTTKVNNVITKTTAYGYDRNGNQLTTAVTAYENGEAAATTVTVSNTYDLRNQLIRTETADGTVVVCTYNGEGYRVTKEVTKAGAAKKTFFLYEGDKAVLELDGNGLQTGRNVYGTNLLFRTTEGTTYSYLYNGHGDVTALVTDSGEAAASYYYDAFGNITESTGTVDNSIRYAGYQYDVETGLYYINARMYDPLTASFLQEDTYTGNAKDPLSLNLYTYCHNDPVSYDDPTGHKRKNVVRKWVAKAKKAVKKTVEKVASTAKKAVSEVKKAVSTAKKEIKKTIEKEKTSSKTSSKGSPPSYAAAGQRSSSKPAASTQAPTSSSLISESVNSVAGNIAKDIKNGDYGFAGNTIEAVAAAKDVKDGKDLTNAGFRVTEKTSKAVVSGDWETLQNKGINGKNFYKNSPAEYASVMKYVEPKAAVSQAFKAKGNYVTGAISIGIDTYSDVSQVEGTYNKAVVATTDVVVEAGVFAASTYLGAYAGAAVGSAICPGIGTIAGVAIGFGVSYFADKYLTPAKREIQYQLAPEVRGQLK